ncbi:hypothetical protein A4G19_08755 [Pasteurellaceae bacterium Macca]|nr:hypothetical protein [Pasteurellaceae bacterium Macca]
MEQSYIFIIIGVLLLTVLIGATIWTNRREKSRVFSNTFSTRAPSTPIQSPNITDMPTSLQGQESLTPSEQHEAVYGEREVVESVKNIKISLPSEENHNINPPISHYQESVENQAYMENSYPPELTSSYRENTPLVETAPAEPQATAEENIITLYVVAAEGQLFFGEQVVQQLESLGCQYGEYQIFHRHLDSTSTSPVVFSVANMMQPGIFDLNYIAEFQTVGLVFFMHLPSVGNDLINLRTMILTAESLAQNLGGFVLNDQQQLFDDASRQDYLLRVKQS